MKAAPAIRACGRGIEDLPADSGEVRFHPAVRVARAHDVISAQAVVFPGKKPVHFARGNAQRSKHDGHGRSEVLTVSCARFEQEMSQRIITWSSGQIQRVCESASQVVLDSNGLSEWLLR